MPVCNYHLAYPSGENPSALELASPVTWMVDRPQSMTDAQVHAFCQRLPGKAHCTGQGHPSESGIAYVAIQATEAELQTIPANHPGAASFVEPWRPELRRHVASRCATEAPAC